MTLGESCRRLSGALVKFCETAVLALVFGASLVEDREPPWPPEVRRRLALADQMGLDVDLIDLVDFVEVCILIDAVDLIRPPPLD